MPHSNAVWYRRWLMACVVHLLSWGLRLLYCTLRPEYIQQHFEERAWHGGTPVLLAFWHGRALYFLHRYHRQRFTILVSHSKDGEFVSQVLQRFGVHVTRGSSSRGGAQGLREIVRKVHSGSHAAAFQSCRGRVWKTDLRASGCFANGLPGQATRGRNEPTTHHGDG